MPPKRRTRSQRPDLPVDRPVPVATTRSARDTESNHRSTRASSHQQQQQQQTKTTTRNNTSSRKAEEKATAAGSRSARLQNPAAKSIVKGNEKQNTTSQKLAPVVDAFESSDSDSGLDTDDEEEEAIASAADPAQQARSDDAVAQKTRPAIPKPFSSSSSESEEEDDQDSDDEVASLLVAPTPAQRDARGSSFSPAGGASRSASHRATDDRPRGNVVSAQGRKGRGPPGRPVVKPTPSNIRVESGSENDGEQEQEEDESSEEDDDADDNEMKRNRPDNPKRPNIFMHCTALKEWQPDKIWLYPDFDPAQDRDELERLIEEHGGQVVDDWKEAEIGVVPRGKAEAFRHEVEPLLEEGIPVVRQAWIFDCISATKRLANQGSNVQWRQELTNYKLPRYSIATIRKVRTEFTEKEIECLAAMLLRVGKPRGFKYEAEAARAAHNKSPENHSVQSWLNRLSKLSLRTEVERAIKRVKRRRAERGYASDEAEFAERPIIGGDSDSSEDSDVVRLRRAKARKEGGGERVQVRVRGSQAGSRSSRKKQKRKQKRAVALARDEGEVGEQGGENGVEQEQEVDELEEEEAQAEVAEELEEDEYDRVKSKRSKRQKRAR